MSIALNRNINMGFASFEVRESIYVQPGMFAVDEEEMIIFVNPADVQGMRQMFDDQNGERAFAA